MHFTYCIFVIIFLLETQTGEPFDPEYELPKPENLTYTLDNISYPTADINLNWDYSVSGIDGFKIKKNGTLLSEVIPAGTTEWTDAGVNIENSNSYQVLAFFQSNNSDYSDEVIITPISLIVNPSSLDFGLEENSLNLSIENTGIIMMNWSLGINQNWISAIPISGSLSNNSQNIVVSVNRTGLNTGNYNGIVTIYAEGVSDQINISMSVPYSYINHFDDLNGWSNTTTSIANGPWEISSYGYQGNSAYSYVTSGGGDRLAKNFNFPNNVALSIWAYTSLYDDIHIDVIVDGEVLIRVNNLDGEWEQRQCDINAGEHEIVIETWAGGGAFIDELKITSN